MKNGKKNGQTQLDTSKDYSNLTAAPTEGSLDKIRDILFGNQIKSVETKLDRFESRVLKELASVREDAKKGLETLENFLRKEIEITNEKLKKDHKSRSSLEKEVNEKVKSLQAAVLKEIQHRDDQSQKNQSDIRKQLLDQSKALRADVQKKFADATHIINKSITDLRSDMMDRTQLARIFSELALRLNEGTQTKSSKK